MALSKRLSCGKGGGSSGMTLDEGRSTLAFLPSASVGGVLGAVGVVGVVVSVEMVSGGASVLVVVALAVGSGAADSDAIGIAKAGVSIEAGGARFASIDDVVDDAVDGGGNAAGDDVANNAAGNRACA